MSKPDRVYVRFVCFRLIESQRQRLGLFQALDEARDCDFAPSWALRQIGEIYGWFKANLVVPSQFSLGGERDAVSRDYLGSSLPPVNTLGRCTN